MVDWVPRAFVKAGLLWLSAGVTLGLAMAIRPEWIVYRPAHVHMNLLGFVAMIIFGVGYQILPRMMGYGLHSRRLAVIHWWLANTGLGLMVAGFILRPSGTAGGGWFSSWGSAPLHEAARGTEDAGAGREASAGGRGGRVNETR